MFINFTIFFIIIFKIVAFPIIHEPKIIKTKYGEIRGFEHLIGINNHNEKITADIFLGIPFAKAPINKLRFEKPEPPEPFKTLNATQFAPACASISPSIGTFEFSEDCLYLNIIKPTKRNETTKKLPVVVWIHGGGFVAGSAKMYGYEALAANFASRGIVVVTIQYRLGMFGFFTTNDKTMSGNLGLWDQRAALLWINENIGIFDGDLNKVKLFKPKIIFLDYFMGSKQRICKHWSAFSFETHSRFVFSIYSDEWFNVC